MRVKLRNYVVMKRIFLILLAVSFSLAANAQGEFLNKSNSIAPKASGVNMGGSNAPSVFTPGSKSNASTSVIEKKKLEFAQTNDFANPNEPLKNKLNKSEKDFNPGFVNRDQFFGVFKTKSEYVRICYRDFGAIDGDVVQIYTPDLVLVTGGILGMECQYVKLRLLKGENTITLKALNEGDSSPNTGELQVLDDDGNVLSFNQWGLGQSFRASVTIYKE
jgi:hypothetical protein